jgi:hypothetical protein
MGGRAKTEQCASLWGLSLMTFGGIIFHVLQTVVNLLRRKNRAIIHMFKQVRRKSDCVPCIFVYPLRGVCICCIPVNLPLSSLSVRIICFTPIILPIRNVFLKVRESNFPVSSSDLICELKQSLER